LTNKEKAHRAQKKVKEYSECRRLIDQQGESTKSITGSENGEKR
jgi:hypothetical protein